MNPGKNGVLRKSPMIKKGFLSLKVQKTLTTVPCQSLNTAYFEDMLACSSVFIFMNRNMNLLDEFNEVRKRLFAQILMTPRQTGIADTDIQIRKKIFVRTKIIRKYSQDVYKIFTN